MSGHLMETMNNEAFAEVDQDTLPAIGDWVIFRARPGESRHGTFEFPALVLRRNSSRGQRGLDLLVVFDSQDTVDHDSVQEWNEQNNTFCWTRKQVPAASTQSQIAELRDLIDELRSKIYGEWAEPPKSMMDYLVEFEGRVKAVEGLATAPKKAAKGGRSA